MKHLIYMAVVCAALGAAPAPQAPQALPQPQVAPIQGSQRFLAFPMGNGYGNYIWVVDTQTGLVSAYRVAKATGPAGEDAGWVVERVQTADEYLWAKTLSKQHSTP